MSPERIEFDFSQSVAVIPQIKAMEAWLTDHGFPAKQVPLVGWVERDVEARTVTALVMAWRPGEEEKFTADRPVSICYAGRHATPVVAYSYGNKTLTYLTPDPRDTWRAVLTIQLDREPAPFPEVTR